ncbi:MULTISPECIES: rod shape-determining protein MreC [Clostridia]|uniref:Cell shape-determining protein MreC n=2 Tax=Clostridia TaxID=186801 RepID=A0A8I0A784_9CLOT|nr:MULTISPECIES: rod shape-determining protein MreC [Clostridia]MBC5640350.1 rod shape-determining protein MreC [Clostridium lentum]MBC5654568.1 rod shape-determining protein MreC [Blautia lenta]MEE0566433.1 rod shape-determining protein MreC [Clostridium sp.]
MKPFKNKLAVTIVLLSVAFCGMIIYSLQSDANGISSSVSTVVSPLQKIVYNINSRVKETVDFFLNFSEVKLENEELKKKNTKLANELIEYESLKDEVERLREALNFTESKNNYKYVGVNIIGYSGNSLSDGYIIDKGSNDGIDKNMVVVSSKGLVGKVTKVASNFAIVQSILNENIAVAVMDQQTREATGVLQGLSDKKDNNMTVVYNLPISSDVKEGDIIITSGLGKIYPKEIPVGTVVSVEEDNVRVMKSAVVEPFVNFNEVEELFVVIPNSNIDEIEYD